MSERFVYQTGDIEMRKTQCDFCQYRNKTNFQICEKYPDRKPESILLNEKKCEYLKIK